MLFGGSMQRTKKNHGFTLIELMVTIAVMAIIATMAAPSFGNMLNRQDLNKSSQELIAILNKARSVAVLERRVVIPPFLIELMSRKTKVLIVV